MGAICETRGEGVLDNTYARILRDFDANAEELQRILRECFRHQAMVVVVEQPYPDSGSAASAFVEALRGWSCLHFIDE